MAGRIVRGIGALGSANVFRGAIALFQRIQHPWKDKLLGTYPSTAGPIYCAHHACTSVARRGFHHSGPIRLEAKTKTVVGNALPPPSRGGNLLPGRGDEKYGFRYPFLHYEANENHHFETFGKQELGGPELHAPEAPPRPFFFNPLLYRSRLFSGRARKCGKCAEPFSSFRDHPSAPRASVPLSSRLSPAEFRSDRLRNEIVKRAAFYGRFLRTSQHRRAFVNLLAEALLRKSDFNRGSPAFTSIVEDLVRSAFENRKALASQAVAPLLAYNNQQ